LTALEERDAQGLLNALEGARFDRTNGRFDHEPGMRYATGSKGSEGALSDLFSAATLKKVEGSGSHSSDYYKARGKPGQTREAAANLNELLGDEYADQWELILNRIMPEMTAAWKNLLKSIAEGTK
jgi:hypothetical protein